PRDSSDHPVTSSRSIQIGVSDRASQLQSTVCGVHPRAAPLHFHSGKERAYAAAYDLFHGAQPAVTRIASEAHTQPVPVHDTPHLIGRKEHAVLHSIDAHEAVTGPIRADGALYDAAGLRRRTCCRPAFRAALVPRCCAPRFHLGLARSAARPAMVRVALMGGLARPGPGAVIAVAAPELGSARAQLTAPDPVRRFRRLRRPSPCPARVAELVDALVSGTSG